MKDIQTKPESGAIILEPTGQKIDGVEVFGVPDKPDPLWPEGAKPKHLGAQMNKDAKVAAAFSAALGTWRCSKCGSTLKKSTDPRYCVDCLAKEAQNNKVAQTINANWMEQSEELGLAIFERQPEETDLEWRIWDAYRRHYPLKMPTWSELAKEVGSAVATVTKTAQKWSFRARLQAWARYADDETTEKRIAAVKEMNEKQLGMAQTLIEKLREGIDNIDPLTLKPNEMVNMFKMATELERRIVTALPERVDGTVQDTGRKTEQLTKAADLSEVIDILEKTGVLGRRDSAKTVAIEQATRVVVREDNDE